MRVIRYFRDLLATLKLIEGHLEKLASCVGKSGRHYDRPTLSVKNWKDWE